MFPKRGNFRNNRNRNYKPYHRNSNQKREYRHCEQLLETEVGISEFISQHGGFGGIIKARFSDFQVHEINLQGEVAKLTNTSIPKEFSVKMVKTDFKEVPQSPNENIPQEKWEAIKNVALTPVSEPFFLEIDNVTKETRKQIHQCVKSHFGQKVISSTIQKDGKQFIKISKYNKDIKTDIRTQWPGDFGEYVYFILYKEKVDTMEACMKLSSALKMPSSKFTHAGTKDRRSITTQWLSVHKVEPWKLIQKARNVYNIRVGNFTFKNEPLKLGQLQGNHFKIALRNITGTDEDIGRSVNDLKKNGFINYFGLQRFGNDKEVPTFQVGIKLLQGKWKEAVQLILKPKASDDILSSHADVVQGKQIYSETGDAAKAYQVANRNKTSSVEFKLLEGLSKNNENDYVNALENVPRSMRLLYLHSFQSFIWNKMVSKRLKLFGMKPMEGDLVFTYQPTDKQEETVAPKSTEKSDDDKHDTEKSVVGSTQNVEDTHSEEGNADFKCKKDVKVLTSEDLSNYTIFDVVMPLPGYDIVYPESLKQYYREALEEHELTLEMAKQKVRSYNLCGDYRKIMEKVEDLSWKTIKYNNPTDDLIRSDLQEMKGEPEPVSVEDGKYKALIIEFSLSSSSYATMVLREIMKCETSSFAQSQMNDYHEDKAEKKDEKKQKKIVIDDTDNATEDTEEIELVPTSSLLSNPDKYEEFKNSIFNSVGESLKRPITDSEVEETSKKVKKDEKDGKITQASLI